VLDGLMKLQEKIQRGEWANKSASSSERPAELQAAHQPEAHL
jgi:hypothetical protein